MLKLILAVLLAGFTTCGLAQTGASWDKWSWLIGEWKGEGGGKPGQGTGTFTLQPELNGKILVRRNHSEYPAAKDKPAVVHDDLMIVFPDGAGNATKADYFDSEGHVIHYTATLLEKSITLLSEKTGNQPLFRLTYTLLDASTVNTRFEISQDGVKFTIYVEGKCVKTK
jgi:hypothetical protein